MHFPLTMPGSKRRVFPQILPHIPAPKDGGGVVIPFFGTGADTQYLHAAGYRIVHCGDGNPHLCKLYAQLRNETAATVGAMARIVDAFPHDLDGQRAWYLDTRSSYNDAHVAGVDTPETAATFLAVWRAAFNGLARANASGLINSPAGMAKSNGAKKTLVDLKALAGFAEWLAVIPQVTCIDYAHMLREANSGDTVYFDPPYVGTFDGYFGEGFDTDRLAREIHALPSGVSWAMSNAIHERWAVDFPDAAQVPIHRAGTVSCNGDGRGVVSEVLVVRHLQADDGEFDPTDGEGYW